MLSCHISTNLDVFLCEIKFSTGEMIFCFFLVIMISWGGRGEDVRFNLEIKESLYNSIIISSPEFWWFDADVGT